MTDGFHVINDVSYCNDMEGAIYLHDKYGEIVMWDIAEVVEQPSLIGVIINTIEVGHALGGYAIRRSIGKCQRCHNLRHNNRDFCIKHLLIVRDTVRIDIHAHVQRRRNLNT